MNYLEVTGTLIGLTHLWLEYRVSIYLWIADIIMPAIYIFVYYRAGPYADFGINIYYLLAVVYGRIVWMRDVGRKSKTEFPTTHIPLERYFPLTAVLLATFLGIARIPIWFTGSNVPWFDSFTTALSVVGMWMLVRKYVE